jgi:hypothetical protein
VRAVDPRARRSSPASVSSAEIDTLAGNPRCAAGWNSISSTWSWRRRGRATRVLVDGCTAGESHSRSGQGERRPSPRGDLQHLAAIEVAGVDDEGDTWLPERSHARPGPPDRRLPPANDRCGRSRPKRPPRLS